MATESQEKLYDEIMHYYNLANQLIATLESAQEKLNEENFAIAEEMIISLEDCSDKLSTNYIEYIKNQDAKKIIMPVRDALNGISAKIEECRGKILMINS